MGYPMSTQLSIPVQQGAQTLLPSRPKKVLRCKNDSRKPLYFHNTMKILSIDGGAPLIPYIFLNELEKRTGKSIPELFQLVVTVSTGAFPAFFFTHPSLRSSLSEVQQLQILRASFANRNAFKNEVEKNFSTYRLRDVGTDLVVACYDAMSRDEFLFQSRIAKKRSGFDYTVNQVLKASCAKPSVLDPFKLKRTDGTESLLLDGGVLGSNPANIASREARSVYAEDNPVIVSVGTGSVARDTSMVNLEIKDPQSLMLFTQAASGTVGSFGPPEFTALGATTDVTLSIFPNSKFRFDTELTSHGKSFWYTDDIFEMQKKAARALIEQQSVRLDELCKSLVSG